MDEECFVPGKAILLAVCLQEEKTIREQAEHISYEGIEDCIRVIRETGARLRANVNFEVAVEMMLVRMKDRFQE